MYDSEPGSSARRPSSRQVAAPARRIADEPSRMGRAIERRRAVGGLGLSNEECPIHFPATPKTMNGSAVAVLTTSSRS